MDGGDLTELLSIRRLAAGRDAAGQPSGAWSEIGTEWASMRQLDGLSTIKADAPTEKARASFRIRWRAAGTYLTTDRVLHNGVTYGIKALLPDRMGRQFVDLVVEEVRA